MEERLTPVEFARAIRIEVESHQAVTHRFLRRFGEGRLSRWQIWGYASQHYYLVTFFTSYLEALANRSPDVELQRLVRDILEEEYMRHRFDESHPALYRRFMRAVGFSEGEWDRVPPLPATHAFVQTHLDMTLRSWLETLGAVGPGHEWAIPLMFPYLIQGIERSAALPPDALEYFRLHIDVDVRHGEALREGLTRWARDPTNQEDILRGARRSLETRAAFWSALEEQLFPGCSAAAK